MPNEERINQDIQIVCQAVETGDIRKIKHLIEEGIDVNTLNQKGKSLLLVAVENNHKKLVEFLLEKQVDPNKADYEGNVPLICAAKNGYEDLVKILLDNGADPNVADNDNNQPLVWAARYGRMKIVNTLIEKTTKFSKALNGAVSNGHIEVINIILPKIKKVGLLVQALNHAAKHDQEAAADILLGKIQTLGGIDIELFEPLSSAAENGNIEIFNTLLSKIKGIDGVKVRLLDVLSNVAKSGHVEIARKLVSEVENLESSDEVRIKLLKALSNVAKHGYAEIVNMLLPKVKDIGVEKIKLLKVLNDAVKLGHVKIANLLLSELGSSDEVRTKLLDFVDTAARGGHAKIVEMLLPKVGESDGVKEKLSDILVTIVEKRTLPCVNPLVALSTDEKKLRAKKKLALKKIVVAKMKIEIKMEIVKLLSEKIRDIKLLLKPLVEADCGTKADIKKIQNVIMESLKDIEVIAKEDQAVLSKALKKAIRNGHEQVVKFLLERGADASGFLKETSNTRIIDILLKNFNFEQSELNDAMNVALEDEDYGHEIVEALVGRDKQLLLNRECKGQHWATALEFAISERNERMVEMLLELGADPNIKNPQEQTALIYAASRIGEHYRQALEEAEDEGMCECQRSEMELENKEGDYKEDYEIVIRLLDEGANPRVQDSQGQDALMHTLRRIEFTGIGGRSKSNIIMKFLNKGADLTLKDNQNNSAFDHAVLSEKYGIAVLLAGAGAEIDLSKLAVLNLIKDNISGFIETVPTFRGIFDPKISFPERGKRLDCASGLLNILDKLIELGDPHLQDKITSLSKALASIILCVVPSKFKEEGTYAFFNKYSNMAKFKALCEKLESKIIIKTRLNENKAGFLEKFANKSSFATEELKKFKDHTLDSHCKAFQNAGRINKELNKISEAVQSSGGKLSGVELVEEITSFLAIKDQGSLLLAFKNITDRSVMADDTDSHMQNDEEAQAAKRHKLDDSGASRDQAEVNTIDMDQGQSSTLGDSSSSSDDMEC